MKELPIAMFANNTKLNPELIALAQEIIINAQYILKKGGSNRYSDIKANPRAYNEISDFWGHKIPPMIAPPEEDAKLRNLSELEIEKLWRAIDTVAKSYKFRIGNCGEFSSLGLYFACGSGTNILRSASLANIKYTFHALIKLESKNNEIIYVDPWFLTSENSGAIFNEDSLQLYLKAATPLLYSDFYIQLLASISSNPHIILCVFLLALSLDSQALITTAKLILPMLSVPLVATASAYYLSQLQVRPYLTINNNRELSNIQFKTFEKLCAIRIESMQPDPLLFNRKVKINRTELEKSAAPMTTTVESKNRPLLLLN